MVPNLDVFGLLLASAASSAWAQTLTVEMIDKMGNNSLFDRWRPISHFSAPSGWMNDPCGPMHDPMSGLYHWHYQWHPDHVNWGNVSWGHATSPDMITWTDVDHFPKDTIPAWSDMQAQSIGTTNLTAANYSDPKHRPYKYNHLGIWSGTAQPVNMNGVMDGTLLAFYTSVSRLPLAWNAPYPLSCESQSMAYSTNGGVTWQEYAGNPVLAKPPGNWNITGFRDPFFWPDPTLDALLNYTEPHYYVIFGSGIGDVGPRIPIYSTPASNLTSWTFLGSLIEPKGNSSLGDIFQTGLYGFNFEVPNFYELDGHWFISAGAQGASTDFHTQNWVIWNEGTISIRPNGSIAFDPISGGASDWGLLYAITSFNDTKNNRRIQLGWAWEDMNNFGIVQQGYQGCFALPRELFIHTVPNVQPPKTKGKGNAVYSEQHDRTYTARTLGAMPAPDVIAGLRKGSSASKLSVPSLTGRGPGKGTRILAKSTQRSYELDFTIISTTGRTGVTVGASGDFQEYTSIYFDPKNSSITVDRLHSSLLGTKFLNTSYTGYFAPYTLSSGGQEAISMRIFVDGSLIEIFANDRFAMTARHYPAREDSTGVGLWADPGVKVHYSGMIMMWNGLLNAWPSRPRNCSSLLVQDTPAEDGNGTWWNGN